MKVYQSYEFCRHIDCPALKHDEEIKVLFCKNCRAYKFHDYLQERGFIMDEKQVEELYRLRERVGIKEG